MDVPAPRVPESLLEGWRPIEDRTERPFQAGPVAVSAHTIVYEDATRRQRIRESIGTNFDIVWRFFFASRLRVTPQVSTSRLLTRIVESNASTAFQRELHERGFESVTRAGKRTLEIRGTSARTTQFDAVVPIPDLGVDVAARATLTVCPEDGEYLLTGGAYPIEVIDEEDGGVLGRFLDPETDRTELLQLIRATS
ncbi:hypothetical protein RH858_07515 [Halalkaliarchaeum sp. AArc-GB]|uniref:hypothetical protein n=1 Tax=Halalkaliarchaeum sp. AArc-GB TaxID=3074078 RepID=UPI0028606758|nr:hypothetical protein [Halalkaliarchaeum sp. AArc-GB]MDR5672997.1 hypothetical protein [Halalkaliarchaeum sp. AArc-GB]